MRLVYIGIVFEITNREFKKKKKFFNKFFFFFLERKKITLTVRNQLFYKKIYNVVGYLKGKRNPGLYSTNGVKLFF